METGRLILTKAISEDIETIMTFEQDPDNRKFVFRGTYEEHLREIEDPNVGVYIVRKKETQQAIGFFIYDLDLESERFELRRVVISEKNQGFGRELFSRIFKYAFEELHMNKLWLDVYHDNKIGIHFYESLGMVKEGVLRQNHKEERGMMDQIIYSVLKDEYFIKKVRDGRTG